MVLMSSFLSAVAAVRGTSRQRVWPPEDYRFRRIIMPDKITVTKRSFGQSQEVTLRSRQR
jgi:hypothetical protein